MAKLIVLSAVKLEFNGKKYSCATGENGFSDSKQEGDKTTPLGNFRFRECWYRADRIARPHTALPFKVISPEDGWCDDAASACYNQPVKLPFSGSHERLWREDSIYDIIIPIGYNDDEIVKGKGSAIFFHLATPDYRPTLGCIAVSLLDMLEIVANSNSHSVMSIQNTFIKLEK